MEFWKLLCLVCSYNRTSAVNCRGFPRKLTAAGFNQIRQLTAEGHLSNLLVFFILSTSIFLIHWIRCGKTCFVATCSSKYSLFLRLEHLNIVLSVALGLWSLPFPQPFYHIYYSLLAFGLYK